MTPISFITKIGEDGKERYVAIEVFQNAMGIDGLVDKLKEVFKGSISITFDRNKDCVVLANHCKERVY